MLAASGPIQEIQLCETLVEKLHINHRDYWFNVMGAGMEEYAA